jgi:hypothetical protein
LEKIPKERLELIRLCVRRRLQKAFPEGEYNYRLQGEDKELDDLLKDSASEILVTLKGSASINHTVSEGGKTEDARLILRAAIENRWQIPIRDLDTGEIKETFCVEIEPDEYPDWGRALFWISFQCSLNYWIRKRVIKNTALYYPFFKGGVEFKPDVMAASIVHISEPGKERNLTKSHAMLAWLLTPASKVAASALSRLKEHKVGLLGSSHEWNHGKRISAESGESKWMYYNISGVVRATVLNSYKDWIESTDWIGKLVGWAHLSTLLEYLAFPRLYVQLVKFMVTLPQPCEEAITYSISEGDNDFKRTIIKWDGAIREGFMMGNPITKPVLRLIHVSELEANIYYLEQLGIPIGNPDTLEPYHRARKKMNRSVVDGIGETTVSLTY